MVLNGLLRKFMTDRQLAGGGGISSGGAYHAPRLRFRALAALIATLALAACRADSFSAPQSGACTTEPGCLAPMEPVDPVVFSSIDDARLRLVPQIGDAATQRKLTGALNALNEGLRNGREADARVSLAQVYAAIAPFRTKTPDGAPVDPPDVSALRLELVPAAIALGVSVE